MSVRLVIVIGRIFCSKITRKLITSDVMLDSGDTSVTFVRPRPRCSSDVRFDSGVRSVMSVKPRPRCLSDCHIGKLVEQRAAEGLVVKVAKIRPFWIG